MIIQFMNAALLVVAAPENLAPDVLPEPFMPSLVSDEPDDQWTGAVALGLYRAFGNTERSAANLTADAKKRREKDRFTLGAWWNYASEEDDTDVSTITDRRYGGSLKYDYFLSEKSYLVANAQAERDDKARLQLRWLAGASYGYQFKEEEDLKLAAEAGLAYVSQDYKTPLPTEEVPMPEPVGPDGYLAARLAYNAEWKPGGSWTLSQTGEAYPSLEDSDNFYSKLDSRVRYDMSAHLFGQFQWIWDYNNNPPEATEKSDYRLFLTVGYSF